MKTQFRLWIRGVMGAALCMPVAGFALAQDSADDNRPRAERQNDDGAREDRGDLDEDRARDKAPASAVNDRVPRSVRTDVQEGSPSDLAPAPLEHDQAPIQPMPMSHTRRHAAQSNCCCGNGGAYSQNHGYRSARMMNNNGAYRSFSYQGGDDAVFVQQAAPTSVYYHDGYVGGRRFGGVQNGANWDRFHEHDSRNFSGSYGSRASLRSR